PRPGVTGDGAVIQWIGAPDATHIYLAYASCVPSCLTARYDLVGSDDGGRTWSTRAIGLEIVPLQVLPSGTLLGILVSEPTYVSSTDGGRTWHPLIQRPGSAAAVPPGGGLICGPRDGSCGLLTVDARGENLVQLANHPPGFVTYDVLEVVDSRVWMIGVDTLARRPAVATSVDGGATWSVHPLTDRPACDRGSCVMPNVDVNAQGTAVAMFVDRPESIEVFRSVGDGWTRLDTSALAGPASWSYVAADGTHIVQTTDGGRPRFWAVAPTADRYTQLELAGLPSSVSSVRLEPDGRYYTALTENASQLFRSTDGFVWSAVITP
ncbi:MAG: exo-alpha-sialidase, partial [Micromonosporaceae bacterium]|nr:exo-alpha-sialidase [Micromonosporaceae bacterium]